MAKYEKKRSARRSTPRRPITTGMESTAELPDPMPCALASILLPASHARGCSMQRGLLPGSCWVRAETCVFGQFMRTGCAVRRGCAAGDWTPAWVRGGGAWRHGRSSSVSRVPSCSDADGRKVSLETRIETPPLRYWLIASATCPRSEVRATAEAP